MRKCYLVTVLIFISMFQLHPPVTASAFNPEKPTVIAMSPDGSMTALAFAPESYGTFRLRKLRKGTPPDALKGIGKISFYMTGESDGQWSSMPSGELKNPAVTGIITMQFFRQGKQIAFKAIDGSITIYNIDTATRRVFWTRDHRKKQGLFSNQAFALSPDNTYLVTPDGRNGILLLKTIDGSEMHHVACGENRVVSVAIDPTGHLTAVSDTSGTITVWSLPDLKPRYTFQSKATRMQKYCALTFSSDGAKLAASYGKGTVLVYDMKNGEQIYRKVVNAFSFTLNRMNILFHPQDPELLAFQFQDSNGSLFEMVNVTKGKNGKTVQTSQATRTAGNFCITPDGYFLVVAAWGRHIFGNAEKLIALTPSNIDLYFLRIKAFNGVSNTD